MAYLKANPRSLLNWATKNQEIKEFIDSQFIQTSIIPTLHFQGGLPRLPIPKLETSCEKYLAAQRPLLNDKAYKATEVYVNEFQQGPGKELQRLLIAHDKANKHTSYISELWFDKYLRDRCPLPLNYNPVLVLNNDTRLQYNDQLLKATNLIVSSLRFYRALKGELLAPDVYHMDPKKSDTDQLKYVLSKLPPKLAYLGAYFYKSYPLDMSQYPNLFETTRIPELDKDRIVSASNSKHITVQYRGNFYTFDVLSADGAIKDPNEILANVKNILSNNSEPAEFPIGVLTSSNRDDWATTRHRLADNGNQAQLKTIDSAIFHVCLDDENVGTDPVKITKQFLHGDGTNRWFDKSFSLILSKDGTTAINFEHSWGDGVAVLRYTEAIYADILNRPVFTPDDTNTTCQSNVRRLDFQLNDHLKDRILKSIDQYSGVCDNLDVNYTVFENVGKNVCKKNKVSPDAVMQLAFQVAYFKMTGRFVPTYESCSTAAFKHGRTETIRPLTTLTQNVALALNSKQRAGLVNLKSLILKCSEMHNILIKEAAMGQGFDRHLFALKCMADRKSIKSKMFADRNYTRINNNILSTSTLNSDAIFAGGFGPVVNDGYGLGYVIKDEYLGVLGTNFKNATCGKDYIDAVTLSFKDIFSILQDK